jgi:DNA-binding Lrp family transcriptional regulator
MINRLGLKGVPLNVYAIIYGFSQDGESEFTGSLKYLCDFCGGVSKPTIIKALKELTEAGVILRRDEIVNTVCFPRYRANLPLLKKLNGGSKENSTEAVKNFNGGSKETLPHNKDDNKQCNKDINNKGDIYIRTAEGEYLGTYKNIKLKETELAKLNEQYGKDETAAAIEYLSEYIELKGYKAKSHYLALRKWVYTAVKEERIKTVELEQREKRAQEIQKKQNLNELKEFYGGSSFDTKEFYEAALRRSYGN